MNEWSITGFKGIDNMSDPAALEQPTFTKAGRFGEVALEFCANFDIDDDNGLVQRDADQDIFTKEFDAGFTQVMAGITYTAQGNLLRYTIPWSTEYDPKRSTIRYSAPITMILALDTGMWVSTTEKLMFHNGRDPSKIGGFAVTEEYDYQAIMGTGEKVHASRLKLENDGFVAVFATTRGICYGTHTGMLSNMSEGVYSYQPAQRGISHIKEGNGMVQYQVRMINEDAEAFNTQTQAVDIEIDSQ